MVKTWSKEAAPDKACKHCGAIYSVEIYRVPVKDDDFFTCRCGQVLDKWRSTSIPEYTLKMPGADKTDD